MTAPKRPSSTIRLLPYFGGKLPAQVLALIPDWGKRGTGCWEWAGTRRPSGYGTVRLVSPGATSAGPPIQAHRFVWEIVNGPIPGRIDGEDVHLDHTCRNPSCVRPEHLEPVPESLNLSRRVFGGSR
jgi:hypothetical protein